MTYVIYVTYITYIIYDDQPYRALKIQQRKNDLQLFFTSTSTLQYPYVQSVGTNITFNWGNTDSNTYDMHRFFYQF